MLIYLAGLRGIPTQLYEAAEIDGAGALRRFFAITLPLLTPTIFFNVILNIIGSWQIFTQALILTNGGPNNATMTAVLYLYRTAFQNLLFGYASAQAWLLFLVVLVFVIVALRSASSWVHYERV
jgi:multiple sugar transport system permease protein